MGEKYTYIHALQLTTRASIIAIMLGRLEMSVDEAIVEYGRLVRATLAKTLAERPTCDTPFNQKELEKAFGNLIAKRLRLRVNADTVEMKDKSLICQT